MAAGLAAGLAAGWAGLRFSFGLLSPDVERGALCGLDAEPDAAPLGPGVAEFIEVGAAAGVAQAGGAGHADAPLGLQVCPGVPGGDVVGPQIKQQVGALLLCLRGLGCNNGGQPGVGLVLSGCVSMGGLLVRAVLCNGARQPG